MSTPLNVDHSSRGVVAKAETPRPKIRTVARKAVSGKTVEIDDGMLVRMLRSKPYLDTFPFLQEVAAEVEAAAKVAAPKKKKCGCASSKILTVPGERLRYLRRRITNMSISSKRRLKKLLRADTVVINSVNDAGQAMRLKF